MKHMKHAKVKSKKTTRKIIIMSIIMIVLVSLIFYSIASSKAGTEKEIADNQQMDNEESIEENQNEVSVPQEQFEMVDVSDFPSKIGGYTVLGKIVIDEIGVENYILNKTTDASLNLAVTWFWGPDENNRAINVPRKCMYYWS